MKKIIIPLLLVFFLFLSSSAFAQASYEQVYSIDDKEAVMASMPTPPPLEGAPVMNLVYLGRSEQCLSDCWIDFSLSYSGAVIPNLDADFFGLNESVGRWIKYQYLYLADVSYEIEVKDYAPCTLQEKCDTGWMPIEDVKDYYQCGKWDADSPLPIFRKCDSVYDGGVICDYTSQCEIGSHKEIIIKQEWKDVSTLDAFQKEIIYTIRLAGKRYAYVGDNSVDAIPIIDGKYYPEFAWWNSSWTYRMPINITENTGGNLNDFQLPITLNLSAEYAAAKINDTCQDVRFTDSSDLEIPYWVENCSLSSYGNATIWIKANLSASTTSTFYIYYGNPAATSESNVDATFIREINGNQPVKGAWRMDEGSGATTADYSGNGNNGTIYDASWVDGKFGGGLAFDAVDDYVDILDSPSLGFTDKLTFELWAKGLPPDTAERALISSRGGGGTQGVTLETYNNLLYFLIADATCGGWLFVITTPSPFTDANQWHHVAGVYDGTNAILYVDGVNVVSATGSGNVCDNANTLRLGQWTTGPFWKGTIDEVRVYNRTLSAAEILDIYNNYGYVTLNYAGRVLVRKYASPEPTYVIGAEETGGGGGPSDTTPPTISNLSINSTLAGTYINHSFLIEDNIALDGFIFSFDNCNGSFVNDSFFSLSGNSSWVNVTKKVSSIVGCTVRWCVTANDTSNNTISTCTEPYTYITTLPSSSCQCPACSNSSANPFLESIVGLSIIAFIFAFLYSKQEKNNFYMRLLFLAMSLFTISLLSWVLFNSASTIAVTHYDALGALTGSESMNMTLAQNVQSAIADYSSIMRFIPIIVIALSMLIFIYNLASSVIQMRNEEKEFRLT